MADRRRKEKIRTEAKLLPISDKHCATRNMYVRFHVTTAIYKTPNPTTRFRVFSTFVYMIVVSTYLQVSSWSHRSFTVPVYGMDPAPAPAASGMSQFCHTSSAKLQSSVSSLHLPVVSTHLISEWLRAAQSINKPSAEGIHVR